MDLEKGLKRKLQRARTTGVLDLTNFGLDKLPTDLEDFNSVCYEGQRWFELEPLKKLELRGNELKDLPSTIGNLFESLEYLGLARNHLHSLPARLVELSKLKLLDLSNNDLRGDRLPKDIFAHFSQLSVLDLTHNPMLSTLPPSICLLEGLNKINLSKCGIRELPPKFGLLLSSVVSLDLSHNFLTKLPDEIGAMESLQELNVEKNNLVEINPHVGKCKSLVRLNARCNCIRDLGHDLLAPMTQLAELYLGNNALTRLPRSLYSLACLGTLDLSSNKLKTISASIQRLTQLKTFDVSCNDLQTLPPEISLCPELSRVMIDGNPLRQLRVSAACKGTRELLSHLRKRLEVDPDIHHQDSIAKSDELRRRVRSAALPLQEKADRPLEKKEEIEFETDLDFKGLDLSVLPDGVFEERGAQMQVAKINLSRNKLTDSGIRSFSVCMGDFVRLKVLDMSANCLESLPDSIGTCAGLEELYLMKNRISRIPESITSLRRLKILDISQNGMPDSVISDIDFSAMTGLARLDLSFNRLSSFPSKLTSCLSIQVINVSNNHIATIPPSLHLLPVLSELDVSNNDIRMLPPELSKSHSIKTLKVEGNILRLLRPAIIARGTEAIMDWLKKKLPVDESDDLSDRDRRDRERKARGFW
ncbi:hypothetical protein ADUPG1_000034 [Aduncisulcus paluster]|uniref:Uncharacterized protein n=1 Tax=Aduncisulcus paluster TaxID=2918883 RepID=A0ABQ5K4C4_9EUKA|nr:hypothetical protein ADUPG1_000034 [Aduncisulcus paluster]